MDLDGAKIGLEALERAKRAGEVRQALADLVAAADNLKRVKEIHRKYPSAENASRIVEYERDFDAAVERARKVL